MKKLISAIMLTIFIITFIVAPVTALALVRTDEVEVPLLQEGRYDIPMSDELSVKSAKSQNVQDAEEYVYSQLLLSKSQINIESYSIPRAKVMTFYSNVINDHPDLFYVSSSLRYNYYQGTEILAILVPEYVVSGDELAAAQQTFYSGAAKALSIIDNSMSDVQKAVMLHDYICSHAHYPNLSEGDFEIYHSAYGFFYDSYIVCAGFALVYSYLLGECGVQSEYVVSDDMGHAWNKVKIGNNWYHCDVTWDDVDYGKTQTIGSSCTHVHFLKSDSYIGSQAGSYHYNFSTYDSTPSTDTTFDNYFWNDITGNILVVDGDYYYIKPEGQYAYLTKRTPAGVESHVGGYIDSMNKNYTSVVYDSDGTKYYVPRNDYCARLQWLDGRFYVTDLDTVYSITMSGQKHIITELDNYCIGFGIDDNNNLTYQLNGTDGTPVTLDKLEYYNTYMTRVKGSVYNNYPDVNYDNYVNAKDFAEIYRNSQ